MGRPMYLADPRMIEDNKMLTHNQRDYYEWLVKRLQELHEAVTANRTELKKDSKDKYDREHKAQEQG